MKNKKNFLANLCISVLSLILIYTFIYLVIINSGDEVWNFNNVYKMYNGYTLYNDTNLIITPFFFYIAYVIFSIFSPTLVVFRIYGVIITLSLLWLCYKIITKLNISKNLQPLYITLIFLFIFQVVVAGPNYNTLAVVFILLGVYQYITNKSSNLRQGLIIFLIFFTKQNMGVYYALSVIIYELIVDKFTLKYIFNQFKKIFYFILCSSLVLLKLHFIDNNLLSFLDFCFGGLLEFGSKNIAIIATPYYFSFPIATIGLYIFTMIKRETIFKSFKDDFFEKLTILFVFATVNTLVIYPIFNSSHFMFSFPLHFIFLFYYFDTLILSDLFGEEKYKLTIKYIVIAILSLLVIRSIVYFKSDYDTLTQYRNENSPFNHLYTFSDVYQKSKDLKNYIQTQNNKGINVLICSHDAVFPMIELKQSHGMYDLLFNGNLGLNGKEKIKQDIDSFKNTEFLVVTNEEDIFVQEPPEIRKYIMDNLEYVGSIHNYSIYTTELTVSN